MGNQRIKDLTALSSLDDLDVLVVEDISSDTTLKITVGNLKTTLGIITTLQAAAIVANTAKVGITTSQATAIADNSGNLADVTEAVDENTAAISLNTAKRSYPSSDETKVGFLSVTQAVDLDRMETDIAALANGMVYKGDFDASGGEFPSDAKTGWFYYVSVGGTIDGVEFSVGDNLVAKIDNASTATYAGNWSKHDQTDAVQSVVGLTGSITKSALLSALNVEDGATADQTGLEIEALLDALLGASWKAGSPWSSDTNGITYNSKVGIGEASDSAIQLLIKALGTSSSDVPFEIRDSTGKVMFKFTGDGTFFAYRSLTVGNHSEFSEDFFIAVRHNGAAGLSKIGFTQGALNYPSTSWMELDAGEYSHLKTYTPSRYWSIHAGTTVKVVEFRNTYMNVLRPQKIPRFDLTTLAPASYVDCLARDLSGVLHTCNGTAWTAV